MKIEPTESEYKYDIEDFYYLSSITDSRQVERDTGLSILEIEEIVGRFNKSSTRAGLLRGKVVKLLSGEVHIRHHFNNKLLWELV